MELHGENSFKTKSIASAAFNIDKNPLRLADKSLAELESIPGIGKSAAAKILALCTTGSMPELDELLSKTPSGILEIMGIKGLGPKKVVAIWKDLGIETVGELLYACNENRLIEAKGFGIKTQEEIKKAIAFKMAGKGLVLYAQAEQSAIALYDLLKERYPNDLISFTGAFRRKCEILDGVDLLLSQGQGQVAQLVEFLSARLEGEYSIQGELVSILLENGLTLRVRLTDRQSFYTQLVKTSGSEEHLIKLEERLSASWPEGGSETEIYQAAGLSYIEPELREGGNEFVLAEANALPLLIEPDDLKGSLHNHSTWSDGVNSLEEMAVYCRDVLQLEYLGICDHSKTAVYARGLSEERVLAQHKEIDELNQRLKPFRIFKGIESDILSDGSLDYDPILLATFDFVVASIHSAFKMTEEKATARLIKAIENPYTTILGHPTGRLLLSRAGYPVDHRKIIDACAANKVVIEINANPLRLDLDWRWHRYAIEKGVMLSVNPDAHSTRGFHDTRYGLLAARKGGLSAGNCLNAMSRDAISSYFSSKKAGQ